MTARAIGWLALMTLCMGLTSGVPCVTPAVPAPVATETKAPGAATHSPVTARMAKLPLRFEANAGQWDEQVRFVARQGGATLFITDEGMTVGLRDVKRPDVAHGATPEEERAAREKSLLEAKTAAVTMKLVGAPRSVPRGEEELITKSNFFLGNDKTKWRTNVPNYAQVRASGWAPGVDVVWHGGDNGLEYDLEVAPGVDASKLELAVEGATKLEIAADGALEVATAAGTLVQRPPRVTQAGREVPTRYAVSGDNRVRFVLEGYDARLAVLIDPALAYSTYLGGSGDDYGTSIAVDGSGNTFVTGYTNSANFPTQSSLQAFTGGDVFVGKLNAAGSALVYSTYLGGSGGDVGNGIVVDANGNAYVTGYTGSANFPTKSPLQPAKGGGNDVFVSKLNPAGSALVYSSYLGGSGDDYGAGIAIDGSGSAYVVGYTTSTNFPTKSAFQAAFGGASWDAFASKLSAAGTALVYSTYLGGSSGDLGYAIAVDGSGSAYVTGSTASTNFPTKNPLQATNVGVAVFVSNLNAAGSALVYSTYLGGSGSQEGHGIAVDPSGNAYVTGYTNSSNFPTKGPIQAALGGVHDAFVSKLNGGGTTLVYSTYLGGLDQDEGSSIAVDASGSAYLTGYTRSTDFPLGSPLQPTYGGGTSYGDAFVSKLNASGSALVYSTYLGGSSDDHGYGIAVDASGSAHTTGQTASADFPTRSPVGATYGGGPYYGDVFVSRIGLEQGAKCMAPQECASGLCTDGVCCNTACNIGGCDRCDLAGSVGTCTVAPASDPGANPVCSPFVCDGASGVCPTSCASDATCAPDYYCTADGTCQSRKPQAAACNTKTDCKAPGCRECTSGNCIDGFCCDTGCVGQCEACDAVPGTCRPVDGKPRGTRPACPSGRACDAANASCSRVQGTCDGDHTTTGSSGTIDCSPYKCDDTGACKPSCGSVSDCVAPNLCSPSGQCIAPPPNQDGGCAASAASPSGGAPFALIGVGLFLARLKRRRRSAHGAPKENRR